MNKKTTIRLTIMSLLISIVVVFIYIFSANHLHLVKPLSRIPSSTGANFDVCTDSAKAILKGKKVGALANKYESIRSYLHPVKTGMPKTGMELEVSMKPADKGKKRVAFLIGEWLKSKNISFVPPEDGRGTQIFKYQKDGRSYLITLKRELSLFPWSDHQGMEITSPIMHSEDDIDFFFEMVSYLKEKGLRAEPGSGGTHLHLGFEDAYPAEMILLMKIFALLEPTLRESFGITGSRWLSEWLLPLKSDLIDETLVNFNDQVANMSAKEFALLIGSAHTNRVDIYSSFKTVEIRIFDSVADERKLERIVEFGHKLFRAAREQDPRLIKYLMETPEEDIHTLKLSSIIDVNTKDWPFRVRKNIEEILKQINEAADDTP